MKDISKDSLVGVSVSVDFKPHLVDLYNATADRKDGDAMYQAYQTMIDQAEQVYGCTIVTLGTDNDGGSKAGHAKLEDVRLWLFVFPCGAHQGQLVFGDYFEACPESAQTSEEATALIGWLNNHSYVRVIFDQVQQEKTGTVLKYLVANLTRWTTHSISFTRLDGVRKSLENAAYNQHDEIISAQVGKETGSKGIALHEEAEEQLELIQNKDFWRLINDLEPICYATNICQSDHARPDIVLLALVGMFLYFRNLPASRSQLSQEMQKQLEQRWKGFDQHLMITALILNPYEFISCFGPKAELDIIQAHLLIIELFDKWIDRPLLDKDSDEQEEILEDWQCQRKELSTAFIHYFAHTGPFKNWDDLKAQLEDIHDADPILFWECMKTNLLVSVLAEFAIMILSIVMNTAVNERHFFPSQDYKGSFAKSSRASESPKENQICFYADGLRDIRDPRKNHSEEHVQTLLEVPRYDHILSTPHDFTDGHSLLVNTRKKWRNELAKWIEQARDFDEDSDDNSIPPPLPESSNQCCKWLPRSLELLFGGAATEDQSSESVEGPRRTRRRNFTEESLLMELLQQEAEDEIPDDGELPGSGDEYED
ncbi:hypothetical protein D9758_004281 [Tetrapyrgos nigripes]|uniref:DUF659 domain-containing protein n=1 Tax=Tetrapyrgos nigripes TaxID=182062 RepID=A0A8H5GU28_9AGAR|nr:hypothetical protein D9758_004281 [Tetrapyrgos nigripes]